MLNPSRKAEAVRRAIDRAWATSDHRKIKRVVNMYVKLRRSQGEHAPVGVRRLLSAYLRAVS